MLVKLGDILIEQGPYTSKAACCVRQSPSSNDFLLLTPFVVDCSKLFEFQV